MTAPPPAGTLLRLAAFTTDPHGGNPAGVWIGPALPTDAEMQRIAADVGYSETAFLAPDGSGLPGRFRVRYFSPLAEVPFCGHATIASGVALAERGLGAPAALDADAGLGPPAKRRGDETRPAGPTAEMILTTNGGPVTVTTATTDDGRVEATLTSVGTWVEAAHPALVASALGLLGWLASELDPELPPALAFAGARHLILAARDLERLRLLEYPFEPLQHLMLAHDLTTIQLVWREAPDRFRARDPFPVGGVVEDPATGAAAAALGAYLRERGVISAPASFEIVQGVEMGRPSRLTVSIAPGEAGIRVSGAAVPIPD